MTATAQRHRFIGAFLVVFGTCGLWLSDRAVAEIHEELVLDLLKVSPKWGTGEPSLLLGALPDAVAEDLGLPESLRILASVQWGENISLVGRTDLSRAAAFGQIESALGESGWTPHERKVQSLGFQPSKDDEAEIFCREDGSSLWVDVNGISGEESAVHLGIGGSRRGYCRGADRYHAMLALQWEDYPFPTLHPPEGAKSSGAGGMSSGVNSAQQSSKIETEMSAGELLGHYADQMAQGGWAPDAATEYRSVAYQSWVLLDSEGVEWHGLLVVTAAGDQKTKECSMRITRLGES